MIAFSCIAVIIGAGVSIIAVLQLVLASGSIEVILSAWVMIIAITNAAVCKRVVLCVIFEDLSAVILARDVDVAYGLIEANAT